MKSTKKRRKSDFYRLRVNIGLSAARAAELCGVTRRTVSNWDSKGAPLHAMRLLHFWNRHSVGAAFGGWEGWNFVQGALQRGRLRLRPDQLENYPRLCERLAWYERQEAERFSMARSTGG